jgi:hypothetical protein
MFRLGVIAACVCACGSPDSNSLTRAGPAGSTGGSSSLGGTPNYAAGGAVSGGGASIANGGLSIGAGGVPFGGFNGSGGSLPANPDAGVSDSGVASGGAGTGGTAVGTGGSGGEAPNPFPPSPLGGLITQACSDCARLNCRAQEDACAADPDCAAIGQCLSTCFVLLTCLGCLPTLSSQSGYAKFTAVSNCTDQLCQPACPFINAGGGTNP